MQSKTSYQTASSEEFLRLREPETLSKMNQELQSTSEKGKDQQNREAAVEMISSCTPSSLFLANASAFYEDHKTDNEVPKLSCVNLFSYRVSLLTQMDQLTSAFSFVPEAVSLQQRNRDRSQSQKSNLTEVTGRISPDSSFSSLSSEIINFIHNDDYASSDDETNKRVEKIVVQEEEFPILSEREKEKKIPLKVKKRGERREVESKKEVASVKNNLIEKALSMSKDQAGCRLLQKKLEEGNTKFNTALFNQIKKDFASLMMDQFGNYLCQKVINGINKSQVSEILDIVEPKLTKICLNNHGTRAVQALIEAIKKDKHKVEKLLSALEPKIIEIILDGHGNHVIQSCLLLFEPEMNEGVFQATLKDAINISRHKHGCCVLQRFLERGSEHQRITLSQIIIDNIHILIQDPFGNYLVQNVVKLNIEQLNVQIIEYIKQHFVSMSKQKFSSNVIEKVILQYSVWNIQVTHAGKYLWKGQTYLKQYNVWYMINLGIMVSMFDIVIQRMLQYANQYYYDVLIELTQGHLDSLKSSKNGKKIYSNLIKNYSDLQEEVKPHRKFKIC